MSRCGRTSQLEALVQGELRGGLDVDLRAHAKQCAVCRHELNWLESERSLFRQRAGRDEVAELWAENERRRGVTPERPWGRVLMGMAAAAVLAVVVGTGSPRSVSVASSTEPLETDALMSPALMLDDDAPCSKLPSGMGFQCAPPVPASFIASR